MKRTNYLHELLLASSPSVWAREKLDFQADVNQKAFLDSQTMDEILCWSRQTGKTQSCGVRIAHGAIYRPGSLQLVVSASQRQAGILQRRVIDAMRVLNIGLRTRVVREIDLPDYEDPDTKITRCSVLSMELANGSAVVSVPASPDTVRGYSPDDIYVDEASRVPDDVFTAIRPMRAAKPVRLTLASTAAWKMGWFFEVWTGEDVAWWRSLVKATDCPRITSEFLARERRTMPERNFRQEYMCEFLELRGAVFPAWMVDAMFSKDVKPLFPPHPADHILDDSVQPLFAGGKAR